MYYSELFSHSLLIFHLNILVNLLKPNYLLYNIDYFQLFCLNFYLCLLKVDVYSIQ